MSQTVLITGGAGFIGSHVANELLAHGYRVRVLDALASQVHGADRKRPCYLHEDVELIRGDIRDADVLDRALNGVVAVYHFVALVGVGQSMYQIEQYTSVNNLGTAMLLERVAKKRIRKLIVASSMSVYGEGLYELPSGEICTTAGRTVEQLRCHEWEMKTSGGQVLRPLPTPEWKTPALASIYALSKFDQEQMCLITGRAYGVPTVALRFFNVYGPNQALSNPYTGVLAIFASRLLNNQRPMIFEDGAQLRDFVSVYDVARACRLALESDAADVAVNIGSGETITIRQIAERLAAVLDKDVEPEITGNYRVGDIRHCYPDISLAKKVLGYSPAVTLELGLEDLAAWLSEQQAHDNFQEMQAELAGRGLVV
ncbi:MAG TPA: NAD-dependent epimerase/dehydratase family protein [Bryobacteraceae bacterium]|nr:NAD-dependent epimerase/dehydratase family protein [Bryobacteraceae bacterium]HXR78435.1 NAD-dependent epimerase/dehydratase family protein [Bryobacteraceae bacterium]